MSNGTETETPRDPITNAEWQEAVDAAEFMICLHSAQAYGLIAGGPDVNLERCEDLLRAGAARGVRPTLYREAAPCS